MLLNRPIIKFQRNFPFLDPWTSSLIFEYPTLKVRRRPWRHLDPYHRSVPNSAKILRKCRNWAETG